MSSPRITLKHFFGLEAVNLTPDDVPALDTSEAYARVKAEVSAKAGAVWRMVRSQVPDALGKLLDVDGTDVLIGAWNKARELRKYRDTAKYPPEDVVIVPLAKHKIESKHRPYLEVSVDGHGMGRLHFDVDLALTLEGVELTIQGGRIRKIRTGRTVGTGTLKCEGAVLHSIEKRLASLPGTIDLGEGVLIPA
jgi:hypothetical protein